MDSTDWVGGQPATADPANETWSAPLRDALFRLWMPFTHMRIAAMPRLRWTPPFRLSVLVGSAGLAVTALLAAGGAAARPGGLWLGLPGAAAAAAVGLCLVGALAHAKSREALGVGGGLLAPCLLLLAGLPLAGVYAVSGSVLAVPLLAAITLVAARVGKGTGRVAFLPLAFLVLVVAAGRSHVVVGPEGDEPHYLMVAESLLRDGDLDLERDFAAGRYASFHDAPLAPHYRVRGRNGEIYSLHAVGLSLLILPAWALAGYAGVTVFMALLAALLAREVREWTAELTGREDVADAAGWLLVLSPPLLHYAGLVFSEVPAALAVAYGLRRARRESLSWHAALAIGLAGAALPWLNVRYAPLAFLLVAHAVWRHRRATLALLAPLLASLGALALYHFALYGFWDPRRVYGRRPEFALATLRDGLPGLFLDQEFGLLVYAPLLVLALPGLFFLLRRDRRLGVASLLAVGVVVLTAGSWHMWRGGFNPPGRFLVPIVPILMVAVGLVFERRGLSAGTALLVGWGLWTGIAGAAAPQLVHRDRDGTAPFFRQLSGAREWTSLLPGYVLEDEDRHRLALVWAGALLLAVPWRRRRPGALRLAVAALGLVAAAQIAATVSRAHADPEARTDDRDAARLVGHAAFAVPGWQRTRAVVAEWSPVGWGPLYEPHRHPAGAELGRRLRLPAGRYVLELVGEGLAPGTTPATLRVSEDRPGAPERAFPFTARGAGFAAPFDVRMGEAAVDLRLLGGGPVLVRAVRLRAAPGQPSGTGPV